MNELEQAVELVENGWCTGNLYEDGNVCAAGAIYAAHLGYSPRKLAELNATEQWLFETQASQYVSNSAAGRALAEEIKEAGENTNISEHAAPYSIIWGFNDRVRFECGNRDAMEAHRYNVIEMMKKAAKRLN